MQTLRRLVAGRGLLFGSSVAAAALAAHIPTPLTAEDRRPPTIHPGQRPVQIATDAPVRRRIAAPTGAFFPTFYALPAEQVAEPAPPSLAPSAMSAQPMASVSFVDDTPTAAQPRLDVEPAPRPERGPSLPPVQTAQAAPVLLPTTSIGAPPPAVDLPPTPESIAPVSRQVLPGPITVPDPVLSPYVGRLQHLPIAEEAADVAFTATIPADFAPWWADLLTQPFRDPASAMPVDVSGLVIAALRHSPTVAAIELEPEIRRTALVEEDAAFDWGTFLESTYDDINEPVGNTLTTGGPDRFKDRNVIGSAGVRKLTRGGGEAELSQQVGWQQTNSRFFIPDQQGNSRLSLSFTQPLLAKNGQAYNNSRIVLARLDISQASHESQDQLQTHLLDVATAYWDLFRARAVYLQRRRVLTQAERILGTLEGRQQVDALPRQVLRARAAVSSRRTEIVRATTEIRNAESRLRQLVADPQFAQGAGRELLPVELPGVAEIPVSLAASARTALMQRAEIRRAVANVRSTGIRLGMAENELMPRLDLVFNTYISGLRGEGRIVESIGDAWTDGRPSFAGGLIFEMPISRRAAKARHRRRELELVQATRQMEATLEATMTEVELAVREAGTTYREMVSQFQTLEATSNEAAYLADRWKLLPGTDRASTILLEDLLDAQSRAADDEAAFVTAQVNYLLALTDLRRVMGTLMQSGQQMTADRSAGLQRR